jgi:hypothetical protein
MIDSHGSADGARSLARLRIRWAAIGAAVAVTLGAGGLMTASAAVSSGERATFTPITPCRVMDTRPAPDTRGPRSTPLVANDTHSIAVLGTNGDCAGIPTDATGVVMNVTVVNPTSSSFLTVFPQGATRPTASSLNWGANQSATPNAVTVDVPASGQVSFFNLAGTVNVIADIVGYYVDHNHDDRYYTKQQADQKSMFAVVNVNGTLRRGTAGVTVEKFAGFLGVYVVTFPREIATCGYAGSPTGIADGNSPVSGQIGVTVASTSTSQLVVQSESSAGGDTDFPFTLVVTCP